MILVSHRDGVCEISLNRPERGNALNAEMLRGLANAMREAAQNPQTRAIFLRGEGKNFCTGADLTWMKAAKNLGAEENIQDAAALAEMYGALLNATLPIVALVQGKAFGGGLGLAACAHIVACNDDATFAAPEARWGLVPGVMAPPLVRKIGLSHFLQYSLTGRSFSATEAKEMGLVHFVGTTDEANKFLADRIQEIKANSTESIHEILTAAKKLSPIELNQLPEWSAWTAKRRVSRDAQARLALFPKRGIDD